MSVETLQTIATVLPLVLLTLVFERRGIHLRIRKNNLFRNIVITGAACSLVGTGMAIIGTAMGGLSGIFAFALWTLTGIAFVSLAISVVTMIVTSEIEEDSSREGAEKRQSLAPAVRPSRGLKRRGE